jgi:crossover junction endodeoxyribonuclease RuvC
MMHKIYIGIDPGAKGSLAYIVDGGEVNAIPFNEDAYRLAIAALSAIDDAKVVCAVEQVSAMPGQGVVSMFNFGKGFGWILGTLEAYGVSYELIRPQKWKKEFSVTSDKNTSIEVCKRLFPNVSLLPTERCKKDNDGMAEALLLAEYARRKMG